MREGLVYTGMMAAVVASATAITIASPNLLRTEHIPSTPGSLPFPVSVPVPTVPTPGGVVPQTPPPAAPPGVVPTSVAQIPPSVKPAPARPAKPAPAPTYTPPIIGQGEPPPPGEPCPIGLVLNPTLGVCVVI
jgi:hypothetical protein